jgi:hypothetical protein
MEDMFQKSKSSLVLKKYPVALKSSQIWFRHISRTQLKFEKIEPN